MKAAVAAGQMTEAARASRIFPESTTAGPARAGLAACPRLSILGKNNIPRIIATSSNIS